MSNTPQSSRAGLGLFSLLTLIFVIAKIGGFINWSWWLVFLPTIIGFSLLFAVLAGCLLIAIIAFFFSKH